MTAPTYGDPVDVAALRTAWLEDITAAVSGISETARILTRGKTTDQSVPNGTPGTAWTTVEWPDAGIDTTGGTLTFASSAVTNASTESRLVEVYARITWASNTGNGRWLSLAMNGTPIVGASVAAAPSNTSLVTMQTMVKLVLPAGSSVTVLGAQNTGGALNLAGALTSGGGNPNHFAVTDLGPLS